MVVFHVFMSKKLLNFADIHTADQEQISLTLWIKLITNYDSYHKIAAT